MSGQGYDTVEELLAAEANGWVAVLVLSNFAGTDSWPFIVGPYATKAEANRARNRMRAKHKRQVRNRDTNVVLEGAYVRPIWKDTP